MGIWQFPPQQTVQGVKKNPPSAQESNLVLSQNEFEMRRSFTVYLYKNL